MWWALTYEHISNTRECSRKMSRLLDDCVNPMAHLLCAFSTRASVVPDLPARLFRLDLCRQESLVVSVIPLPDLLCDDVVGQLLDMVKEEVESLVSADAGRHEYGAQVGWIEDLCGGLSMQSDTIDRNVSLLPGPTSCTARFAVCSSPRGVKGMSERPV